VYINNISNMTLITIWS